MTKPATRGKEARLAAILAKLGRVAIAYSGGVDSTLLLGAAVATLGRANVLAVTAQSPTSTRAELAFAARAARRLRAPHLVVRTAEFEDPEFRRNPPERCYICKRIRFAAIKELAAARGFAHVCDGTNAEDEDDFRPGLRAAAELAIRSPLKEAGFAKADIRAASRRRGLPGEGRHEQNQHSGGSRAALRQARCQPHRASPSLRRGGLSATLERHPRACTQASMISPKSSPMSSPPATSPG